MFKTKSLFSSVSLFLLFTALLNTASVEAQMSLVSIGTKDSIRFEILAQNEIVSDSLGQNHDSLWISSGDVLLAIRNEDGDKLYENSINLSSETFFSFELLKLRENYTLINLDSRAIEDSLLLITARESLTTENDDMLLCYPAISDNSFKILKEEIQATPFNKSRILSIENKLNDQCLSCSQFSELIKLVDYDDERYELLIKYASSFCPQEKQGKLSQLFLLQEYKNRWDSRILN